MRKSIVSLLLAALLLFAFTTGVLAEETVDIVVLPGTDSFTIGVPVASGDRTISAAQIYFELSDNLEFVQSSVELKNVPKGASILTDVNTVGFYYMSTATYIGNDGRYLLTFKFKNDQPGEITFTERKYVKDLGAGKVESVKEQERMKVVVHRKDLISSAPSGQGTSSAPVSSNATTSQVTSSAPVSSNTVTSQPPTSGTSSTPNVFEVQLPEQTRPASSEPTAPTPGDPSGSGQPGTPSGGDPTTSAPASSAPTSPGEDEKPTSWWIVVAIIVVLAAAGGGFWIGQRGKRN